MLDRAIQQGLRPLFTRAARGLMRLGIGADALSLAGFAIGIGAAVAIALGHFMAGLALLVISRCRASSSGWRGVPQRFTSTLSASLAPSGQSGEGRFGICKRRSRI